MLFAITNKNYCLYIKNKRKTWHGLAGRNALSEGGMGKGPHGWASRIASGPPRGVTYDKKGIE